MCVTPQDSTGSGLSFAVALAVLRSNWGRLQVPVLKARNPINVVAEAPHKNWHLQGCYTYMYRDLSGRQTNAWMLDPALDMAKAGAKSTQHTLIWRHNNYVCWPAYSAHIRMLVSAAHVNGESKMHHMTYLEGTLALKGRLGG